MPTENRSSNTEMVSIQATIESLEEAYAGDSALEFMNHAAQLLRQFKAISTQQHQGEPVALPERKGTHLHYDTLMPTFSKGWNACLDEIAKLGPLYSRPAQGEPVGEVVAFGKGLHEIAWAAGRMPGLGAKLYTQPAPADPGEVERLRNCLRTEVEAGDSWKREAQELRADLEAMRLKNNEYCDEVISLRSQLDEQKARHLRLAVASAKKREGLKAELYQLREMFIDRGNRLAERDALLREAHDLINSGYLGSHDSRTRRLAGNLRDRIKAALSASAEPSAAVERDDEYDYRTDLAAYFGLSYASWLTLPRVLMEAMPKSWQAAMATLLHQYDDAYPNQPDLGTTVRVTENGKIVRTPEWLENYRHPDHAMLSKLRSEPVKPCAALERNPS